MRKLILIGVIAVPAFVLIAVGTARAGPVDPFPPGPFAVDNFFSIATHAVTIFGIGDCGMTTLTGPTSIRRSPPDNPPTGTIITEIVSMNLVGSSPLCGSMRMRESPTLDSLGKVFGPLPGPAFFHAFVEIDTTLGTLFNKEPCHMDALLTRPTLPPFDDTYFCTNVPVPLFLLTNPDVQVGKITFASHLVRPVPEPATLLLLGSGLAGVFGSKRRRRYAWLFATHAGTTPAAL